MYLGTDAEFAVRKGGVFFPAGILPINGVKGFPESTPFGGVEIDCCAVEITPPPAKDEQGFVTNITNMMEEIKRRYPEHEFVCQPSVEFSAEALWTTRFANEMGCQPDFCVWTGQANPKPFSRNLRTYGGHVHFEYGTEDTIKAADLTLGLWSVLMDNDTKRRSMYGKAGAFRAKEYPNNSYGMEYRTLSNFWYSSEQFIRKVYQLSAQARDIGSDKYILAKNVKMAGGAKVLQHVINNSNKEAAMVIMDAIGVNYEA